MLFLSISNCTVTAPACRAVTHQTSPSIVSCSISKYTFETTAAPSPRTDFHQAHDPSLGALFPFLILCVILGIYSTAEFAYEKCKGSGNDDEGTPAGNGASADAAYSNQEPSNAQGSSSLLPTAGSRGSLHNLKRSGRDSDDEDQQPRNPKRTKEDHDKSSKSTEKRVHCLHFLKDPTTYHDCSRFKFKDWKGFREHIVDRTHRQPVFCRTCGKGFVGDHGRAHKARDEHERERKCQETSFETPSGITEDQDNDIRKLVTRGRRVKDPLHEICYKVWDILFKDTPRPSSLFVTEQPKLLDPRILDNVASELWTDGQFQEEVCNLPVVEDMTRSQRMELAGSVIRMFVARVQTQGNRREHDEADFSLPPTEAEGPPLEPADPIHQDLHTPPNIDDSAPFQPFPLDVQNWSDYIDNEHFDFNLMSNDNASEMPLSMPFEPSGFEDTLVNAESCGEGHDAKDFASNGDLTYTEENSIEFYGGEMT